VGASDADAISREFLEVLNDIAGTHAMALMGIIRMAEWAAPVVAAAPSHDSTLFVGHGDPNSDAGFSYQRWPLRSLLDRLDADGPVVRQLGQQWVVMVASQWNDHYRARIADAHGVAKNDIAEPVMADINRMRNDIIHHRGLATAANTGRCEVLRWFTDSEPIHVMPAHIAAFMDRFGLIQPTADISGGPFVVKEEL
jgi:hypothetical protein